ncbi:hypothetical protein M5K25_007110 [Dendrobium thyrsiflorum]|uniref:Uncharacterized protein n=1 Tax=Dendrobium thyrsiflorum TaxID=117978 RepID=A0ABD0VDI8_DENTH
MPNKEDPLRARSTAGGSPSGRHHQFIQFDSIVPPLYSELLGQVLTKRMVGGVMMSPIKIPWFRRPEPSWSLAYLVRGGSRPNLTEGSLSTAIGCFVQGFDAIGEYTSDDHDRNIMVPFGGKPPNSEGPGRNRLPTVPFGGKTIGVVPLGGETTG